ncbi:extracellular solute-binding protein [Alloscardovia venturai]|uniref:Extracellular solute-binding protein n=1 Tax=Alloscardovia venturai TaxID=1769421 RepID=A0ABW2Y2G3_9BIFI
MQWKKVATSAIATVGILAMLGACGSGAQGVTDTKKDKGLDVIGTNIKYDPNHLVNGGKPITLDYWTWNPEGVDPVYKLSKDYSKIYPNVKINIKKIAWDDYWTKLPLQLKGKNGPAVFNIHNSYDSLVQPYAATYDVDKAQLEADYPSAVAHEDAQGKVKYIDSVINTGNIYYNKDLWKAAGLTDNDIPKTWDQFIEIAKKLTKFQGSKMTQAGFNYNGAYSAIYQGLNYQKGELLFTKDGKKANYDNAVTRENMQFLKDMYEKDKIGSVNFGNDYSQSFGQGQTAMVYAWGWLEGTMKEKYPKINYGVFPTPTFDANKTPFAYDRYNGESTPGINKNQSAQQQKVAQDFVKYLLANDDYVRQAVTGLNSFPAKANIQNDPEILKNPVMASIKDHVNRLIWPGATPATVESSGQTAFEDVMNNGKSISEAVKNGQKTMDKDMKGSSFVSTESKYEFFSEHK